MSDTTKAPLMQLNTRDKRVQAWYAGLDTHNEVCNNRANCKGCASLERRNLELRAIPGLLVESHPPSKADEETVAIPVSLALAYVDFHAQQRNVFFDIAKRHQDFAEVLLTALEQRKKAQASNG